MTYYKFSGFSQRLTGSAPATAYSPQGLRSGLPAEPPTMTFATPTKMVSESGAMVEYLGVNKVPYFQRLFQTSDGVPVHLKRGVPDRLLYRTTMALTVGGALYCLVALYIASSPISPAKFTRCLFRRAQHYRSDQLTRHLSHHPRLED
uniref:Uncharacterized protein n=1 Tax=Oncorhynchus tshawytscha TaxID=74940 RepID=A0AAZ3Q6N5_ONCTS